MIQSRIIFFVMNNHAVMDARERPIELISSIPARGRKFQGQKHIHFYQ